MPQLGVNPDRTVFPSPKGDELSEGAMLMLLRGMAIDGLSEGELPRWRDPDGRTAVPHGFRSTFKEWSLAKGWPDHLSEKALAHINKNETRSAYANDLMTEERRPMMQAWADYVTGPVTADENKT